MMRCHRELVEAMLLLVGALSVGAWALLGDVDESLVEAGSMTPGGPLDYHGCVELVMQATARGGANGLLRGVAAVLAVWIAEVLSASTGLVASVLQIPLLGLLIGAGLGISEGVGRVSELSGPGALWEAVGNGLRGAGVGARVAALSGVPIGGIMCILATVAIQNVVKGGKLRMAPLLTATVTVGAATMVLSLTPGCMATGALVGCVLGTVTGRDLRTLGAIGVLLGLGWWHFGLGWLGGVSTLRQVSSRPMLGVLVSATVAGVGVLYLGLPLQWFSGLVSVPLGVALAYLYMKGGEAVCKALAEVVDKLFGAININTHYGHDERLVDAFK